MTTISHVPIPTSSPDLPPVERHAALPAGFKAGGLAAGIKASGRPDLAVIATTGRSGGRGRGLHAEHVRGRARPPVACPPRGHVRRRPGWVWLGRGDHLDERERQRRDRTGGRCRPARDRPPAGRRRRARRSSERCTSRRGSSGPACRSIAWPRGSRRLVPRLRSDDAGLPGGRRSPAHDGFGDQDRDHRPWPCRATTASAATVTVSGIAKGVGMIHPQMATMLSVILTDAAAAPETLWGLLRPAAARTWNQLSVDGDTSTNDTVFLLASGASRRRAGRARDSRGARRSAPRSRRSRATWPASRRPMAKAPRR